MSLPPLVPEYLPGSAEPGNAGNWPVGKFSPRGYRWTEDSRPILRANSRALGWYMESPWAPLLDNLLEPRDDSRWGFTHFFETSQVYEHLNEKYFEKFYIFDLEEGESGYIPYELIAPAVKQAFQCWYTINYDRFPHQRGMQPYLKAPRMFWNIGFSRQAAPAEKIHVRPYDFVRNLARRGVSRNQQLEWLRLPGAKDAPEVSEQSESYVPRETSGILNAEFDDLRSRQVRMEAELLKQIEEVRNLAQGLKSFLHEYPGFDMGSEPPRIPWVDRNTVNSMVAQHRDVKTLKDAVTRILSVMHERGDLTTP